MRQFEPFHTGLPGAMIQESAGKPADVKIGKLPQRLYPEALTVKGIRIFLCDKEHGRPLPQDGGKAIRRKPLYGAGTVKFNGVIIRAFLGHVNDLTVRELMPQIVARDHARRVLKERRIQTASDKYKGKQCHPAAAAKDIRQRNSMLAGFGKPY